MCIKWLSEQIIWYQLDSVLYRTLSSANMRFSFKGTDSIYTSNSFVEQPSSMLYKFSPLGEYLCKRRVCNSTVAPLWPVTTYLYEEVFFLFEFIGMLMKMLYGGVL